MNSTEVRAALIKACELYVKDGIERIHKAIAELEEALKLETKCSMGDKYETGRAMLHLEFEKLSLQLEQYGKLKKTLSYLPKEAPSGKVAFGSVVITEEANYFLAIPAGAITVDNEQYFAVGTNSPVARELMGKSKADSFQLHGVERIIKEIF